MKLLPAILVLPFVPALACSSTDSSDVKTHGMHATYTAVSDGSGTRAEAVLKVGGAASNDFVKLSSGDTLTVTAGSETSPLTETHFGELYSYVADLQADAAGTVFTFNFDRTDDEDAPASSATMPTAFNVTAPAAATVVSRAGALTITWDNSATADQMSVDVKGDCILDFHKSVTGDPGTFTINAGDLRTPDNKQNESCSGTVVVNRTRAGTLDAHFGEGGSVTATQMRSVSVRLDP